VKHRHPLQTRFNYMVQPVKQTNRDGFTLIETLVTLAIIGVIIALLLPAVVSVREAARRLQCTNNMKQIGIAIASYVGVHDVLPAGRGFFNDPRYVHPGLPCASWTIDKSYLVSVLPYCEMAPLYNSINSHSSIFQPQNQSIIVQTISTYVCPSDPIAFTARPGISYASKEIPTSDGFVVQGCTSYCGVRGSEDTDAMYDPALNCQVAPNRLAAANGCLIQVGNVRLSSITDGLSNTSMLAERSVSLLLPLHTPPSGELDNFVRTGWWFSGAEGDTLNTNFYPPNVCKTLPITHENVTAWLNSASSQHSNGLNIGMVDGSVRFVRDSVSSWKLDPNLGVPLNSNGYSSPPPPSGIWQALGSRNGSEVMGSSDY